MKLNNQIYNFSLIRINQEKLLLVWLKNNLKRLENLVKKI